MHEEKHFESPAMVRDIVIGMADGLTVPFALAAGLSGAIASNTIIITAGVAEIIAGSIAMGLGGYLSAKTEADHYAAELRREYDEVNTVPEKEKQEVKDVLASYGISEATQSLVAQELSENPDQWVDFMMKFELQLSKPESRRAGKSAFNIAASYIAGGLIPLSVYFVTESPTAALPYSAAITIVALFIFGYFKARITAQSAWKGAFSTAGIGALAASAAYFIARLISI